MGSSYCREFDTPDSIATFDWLVYDYEHSVKKILIRRQVAKRTEPRMTHLTPWKSVDSIWHEDVTGMHRHAFHFMLFLLLRHRCAQFDIQAVNGQKGGIFLTDGITFNK